MRTIGGNDTLLADPHGIALDVKNRLIFVSNFGNGDLRAANGQRYGRFDPPSITVYPMDASGNVKPVHVIQGPKTMMNWPIFQFSKGSYSCPRVGQVTSILEAARAPELQGRLLFAGEHTSLDFGGFMNGAIQSGNRAAGEILAG